MDVKFNLKGLTAQIPEVEASIGIEEITYEVKNANVVEIAQASRQILQSLIDVKREIEGEAHSGPVNLFSYDEKSEPVSACGLTEGNDVLADGKKAIILRIRPGDESALIRVIDGDEDYTTNCYLGTLTLAKKEPHSPTVN